MLQPLLTASSCIYALNNASSHFQEPVFVNKAPRLQDTCKIQELKVEKKSIKGGDGRTHGGPSTELQKDIRKE